MKSTDVTMLREMFSIFSQPPRIDWSQDFIEIDNGLLTISLTTIWSKGWAGPFSSPGYSLDHLGTDNLALCTDFREIAKEAAKDYAGFLVERLYPSSPESEEENGKS